MKKYLRTTIVILLIFIAPLHGVLLNSRGFIPERNLSNPVEILVFNPDAEEELVIYTHDSFLVWGDDPETTLAVAFDDFGVANNVTVTVVTFSGMVDALNTLIIQKDAPIADIVIGLDNAMVGRAKEADILSPYDDANLENVSTNIIAALDPEKYLVPIDFGLLAIIYDSLFLNTTTNPELTNLTFETLLSDFGEDLALQDPTLSATGLNFLLYQIVFYEKILEQDWTGWWEQAKNLVSIDKSWSDSWDRVFTTKQKHLLASYGTDPAYNAYFGYGTEKNGVILQHNGTDYGWAQIEGIGIVNGAENITLAKRYIDYALSPSVQNLIATNNWMFPANNQTILDPSYDYAISIENVSLLNELVSVDYISEQYQTWLSMWEQIIFGTGLWWLWVLIPALTFIVVGVIGIIIYRGKAKVTVK